MFELEAISIIGKTHSNNQDALFIPTKAQIDQERANIFCLADGLGGYPGGELASEFVVRSLSDSFYSEDISDYEKWFHRQIKLINNRIMEKGRELEKPNMSSTLVSLILEDNIAYVQNCGDSRLYLFSEGHLRQISEDHSPLWDLYKKGKITKDDIVKNEYGNVLTEAIGLRSGFQYNSYKIKLPTQFTIILTSDGLSDAVHDGEIEDILVDQKDSQVCLEQLQSLAVAKGSNDDISIILLKYWEG